MSNILVVDDRPRYARTRSRSDTVADELRGLYGETPIRLIRADGKAEEKARQIKAFDFLPKPFDLDRVLGIVHRRLGSST